jgi:hypothetical protein
MAVHDAFDMSEENVMLASMSSNSVVSRETPVHRTGVSLLTTKNSLHIGSQGCWQCHSRCYCANRTVRS